jgi:drug/metabolite transporter (DMT)-like permease
MSMGFGALGSLKALAVLPVSICVLIFFTYPLFTMIFGRIPYRIRPKIMVNRG